MRSRLDSQRPGISAPESIYKANAALGRGRMPKADNRQTQKIPLEIREQRQIKHLARVT
jgi:hypothetical protein